MFTLQIMREDVSINSSILKIEQAKDVFNLLVLFGMDLNTAQELLWVGRNESMSQRHNGLLFIIERD